MLGEKIGTEQGKVTSRRVLPGDDYRYIKMEITFEAEGTLFGEQVMDIGTYTIFERVPGQMYGEGQGVIQTAAGEGVIWKGHGIGRGDEKMNMAFAFSIACQAGPGKLARLNECLVIGEHTINAAGEANTTTYEWKA